MYTSIWVTYVYIDLYIVMYTSILVSYIGTYFYIEKLKIKMYSRIS